MNRRRTTLAVALLGVIALAAAACSTDDGVGTSALPPASSEPRSVFVSLGGDETLTFGRADGFRQHWTRQVFGELPRSTVYVNLATEDATTRTGLDVQLDEAVALEPTVATVWFGSGDERVGTDPDTFASELTQLVTALRDSGATVLLIANTGDDRLASYLPRIKEVAAATGTTDVAVPGPVGNPGDPAAQDAIARAVIPHLTP